MLNPPRHQHPLKHNHLKKVIMTKLIKLLFLMICFSGISQERITINATQDARLLFVGDDKGNDAGTLNLTFRSEWQGKQQKYGFMFVAPEFEYADLKGGIYRRYSMNVGYTFQLERVFDTDALKNIQATSSIGLGTIDHNGGYYSFGSNFQLGYEIGDMIVLFVDLEVVDRLDLQFYETESLRFTQRLKPSGKFGIKVFVERLLNYIKSI